MKPAAFEYFAPKSVEEALALLAEYGYDAKPLGEKGKRKYQTKPVE